MKKIKLKIVGQPMYNIGDLAAFKSVNKLFQSVDDFKIEYSIFENRNWDQQFLKNKQVSFLNDIPITNKYEKMFTILFPNFVYIISFFYPKIKNRYRSLLKSDFVLFAPGGLEFGLYKEWDYLWMLSILVAFKRNFGIYSRSIGDFKQTTLLDYIFKKKVVKYLKKSTFNGLRDKKSQIEALNLGVPFFASIDVVFSHLPDYSNFYSDKLVKLYGNNYIVFTPSDFDWHPKFSTYPSNIFLNLYLDIINFIIKQTDSLIVMLPHIYKDNSDLIYFNSLKEKCLIPERVIIYNDNPDSDVYQFIISKSKCAILSRLHQTIFAINNCTPFLSISYEHKMEDMMKIIELEDFTIRLKDILENKVNIFDRIDFLLEKLVDFKRLTDSQKKANKIAIDSFEKFRVLIKTL